MFPSVRGISCPPWRAAGHRLSIVGLKALLTSGGETKKDQYLERS